MEIIETALPGVKLIRPKIFEDQRGFFYESCNEKLLNALGIKESFVQDNHSHSIKDVLRGLHYQVKMPQGKLVRAVKGEIYDVAVDMRKSSPHFGKWVGMYLSDTNYLMAWIPAGFAHGFLALSDDVDIIYKVTAPYDQTSDRTLLWNDPSIAIKWPLTTAPLLSEKDTLGKSFHEAECFS